MRLFKPEYIPVEYQHDESKDEKSVIEEPITQVVESYLESEYNERGHLDKIKTIDEESTEFEEQLGDVIKYIDEKEYENRIELSNRTNQNNIDVIEFEESQEYDFALGSRGEPVYDLSIKIGSNDIPRISCACHKNNIAVRLAIDKSNQLSKLLRRLSAFAGKHKNSINTSKFSIKKKPDLEKRIKQNGLHHF